MEEKPIIFSRLMIRAILEDKKTMTRRICREAIDEFGSIAGNVHPARESGWIAWWPGNVSEEKTKMLYKEGFDCLYGQPGDKLWVRETACLSLSKGPHLKNFISYQADNEKLNNPIWTPSIFMPRWASRITLEITGVKVERLRDISDKDIEREGIIGDFVPDVNANDPRSAKIYFMELWDSLNAKRGYGWDLNPWVWCIAFKRV